MTRHRTIWMKMTTSLLKSATIQQLSHSLMSICWVHLQRRWQSLHSHSSSSHSLKQTLPCQFALRVPVHCSLAYLHPQWGLTLVTLTLKMSSCWSWTRALFSELQVAAHVCTSVNFYISCIFNFFVTINFIFYFYFNYF